MSQEVQTHILKKFELVKLIGGGAYGKVWKVIDRKTKQIFALKKIFDAFQHATDAQRTYREIMFLKEFDHDNIIKLFNVIRAENDKDVYLVFEYMEADLHNVIRQNILQEIHKQFITYQIGKSLKYLHSAQLLHRDLKPSNILINPQCIIKVCDFGLIRSIAKTQKDNSPILTQYIATRWYRAPQILLGSHNYTKGVDMWSFGCIIGQLLIGKPMFPGKSTLNQLEKIITFTNKPSSEDIKSIQSDLASSMIESLPPIKVKSIKQWFPNIPEAGIHLVTNLLQFNPKKRLSAQQVLNHPFVQKFHKTNEQPRCNKIIKPYVDDNKKLHLKDYRQLIYEYINRIKKDKKQQLTYEIDKQFRDYQKKDAVIKDNNNYEGKIYERYKNAKNQHNPQHHQYKQTQSYYKESYNNPPQHYNPSQANYTNQSNPYKNQKSTKQDLRDCNNLNSQIPKCYVNQPALNMILIFKQVNWQ